MADWSEMSDVERSNSREPIIVTKNNLQRETIHRDLLSCNDAFGSL